MSADVPENGHRKPIPPHMAHLPVHRGMPVPNVVAWSSEGEWTIRHDPLVDQRAVFCRGRQGRGRPLFGVMTPDRQRRAVIEHRCLVCDYDIEVGGGWLPTFPEVVAGRLDGDDGSTYAVYAEPLACEQCAHWSVFGCPGIRGRVDGMLHVTEVSAISQIVDPGRAMPTYARRFDRQPTAADLVRLSRIAGSEGVVGYVKWTPLQATHHPLTPTT